MLRLAEQGLLDAVRVPPEAIHTLDHHSMDVWAMFMALVRTPVLRARVQHTVGRDLGAAGEARLGGFAGRHDGGKAASPWVGKVFFGSGERADHEGLMVHMLESTILKGQSIGPLRAAADALGWRTLLEACGGDGQLTMQYVRAAALHHGGPREVSTAVDPDVWSPRSFYGYYHQPVDALRSVGTTVDQLAGDTGPPGAWPLPDVPALVHLFHGLVTAADWIASTERFFPYAAAPDEDRTAALPGMVARARCGTGFTYLPTLRSDAAEDWMSSVCGGRPSRPLQAAVGALPIHQDDLLARLLVIEDRTGAGKTEAALIWFVRLYALGLVDGLVFALPTRSSAAQIFRRVRDIVKRLFRDFDAEKHVVCAVPGYAPDDVPDRTAEEDRARDATMGDGTVTADAQARGAGVSWAAESSKRFLAAPIVIGTIDQVLLSSLRVRHAHMRAVFVLGKLLVVDEVHSYDAYMAGLLGNVVRRQVRMGGHALLMSATLGVSALQEIMGQAARTAEAAPSSLPFPLLRSYDAAMEPGETRSRGGASLPRLRFTAINSLPGTRWPPFAHANPPQPDILVRVTPYGLALDEVEACVRAGGRVLIVRSTVRKARDTLHRLRARGVPCMAARHQQTGAFIETLHHSRFAQEDRRILDRVIEHVLQAKRPLASGVAVVATQTCEQSLDIDADLLVSDPCPADVLIQRLGRLFRHLETARPPGWGQPLALLLDPGDWDQYLVSRGEKEPLLVQTDTHSFAVVYRNLAAVRRTVEWFSRPGGRTFNALTDARPLVEACTDWHSLRGDYQSARGLKSDEWKKLGRALFVAKGDKARSAESACFRWDSEFGSDHVRDIPGEAVTRLDIDEVTAMFPPGTVGPFGAEIRRVALPRRWVDVHVADPWAVTASTPVPGGGFRFSVGGTPMIYGATGVWPEGGA